MRARSLALVSLAVLAVGPHPAGQSQPSPDAGPTPNPTLDVPFHRGLAYGAWHSGHYSSAGSDFVLVHQIRPLGVDWVQIIVTCYQETIGSTTISCTHPRTETDDDLRHVMRLAQGLGMKVQLAPHVATHPEQPGYIPGQEKTAINFGSDERAWAAWFDSYRAFTIHYATLAREEGAEEFLVGNELPGTSHREAEWRSIIAGVRAIYPGRLTFAAIGLGREADLERSTTTIWRRAGDRASRGAQ